MKQKRILCINDISCMGKCSLTVALPIISILGVEGLSQISDSLSTHNKQRRIMKYCCTKQKKR